MKRLEREKKSYLKTVSLVMIFMLLGKATGLLREALHAAEFGTENPEALAFSFASMIPNVFLDVMFASAISASFIPVFNEYLEKRDKRAAFSLANKFITMIFVLTAVVTVLAIIGADGITGLFAFELSAGTRGLAAYLLRILLPTIVLTGLAFSVIGVLQSLGEFNIPAAMSVISNVIIIIYYLFFIDKFGVVGLAVVFLIGWVTQLVIQLPPLIKRGYVYKPEFGRKDPGMRQIYVLMLPVLVSSWVAPINLLVNTMAAGDFIAAVRTANQFYAVVTGVFVLSIANVMLPRLSRISASGNRAELMDSLKSTLSGMSFLLLPMTAGLFVLARPVITIVFQRGEFDETSTEFTSQALQFFALGMAGFGFQTVLSRAFYAMKDGKTPLWTSLAAIVVNAGLSFSLVSVMGPVIGPALASTASLSVAALLMFIIIYRKDKNSWGGGFFAGILKMTLAAGVMGVCVYYVSGFMAARGLGNGLLSVILSLAVSVFAGVAVYFLMARLLRIGEIDVIMGYLKRGRKRA